MNEEKEEVLNKGLDILAQIIARLYMAEQAQKDGKDNADNDPKFEHIQDERPLPISVSEG